MTVGEILATIVSSLGLSVGGAWVLAKVLVEHRLKLQGERLESRLSTERKETELLLTQALAKERTRWEAEFRKEVAVYVGDRDAEREYKLEAKKRLYQTIGPLRLQLLLACRELAERIEGSAGYVREEPDQKIFGSLEGYYTRSTIYRVLRPIALTGLIQQKIAVADFSVDPSAIGLLRFRKAMVSALADWKPTLDHPAADWDSEADHVFANNIGKAGTALVVSGEGEEPRMLGFEEFNRQFSDKAFLRQLEPFPELIKSFSVKGTPILWIRFCCLAYLANRFIAENGTGIGFAGGELDIEGLLKLSPEAYTRQHLGEFEAAFESTFRIGL